MSIFHQKSKFWTMVNRVKPPTSDEFNVSYIEDLFNSLYDGLDSDRKLFISAIFIHDVSKLFRRECGEILHNIGPALSVKLASAAMIVEHYNAEIMLRSGNDKEQEVMFVDKFARIKKQDKSGRMVSLDANISSIVDACSSWIYDAYKSNVDFSIPEKDINLSNEMISRVYIYTYQKSLHDLWLSSIWGGMYLDLSSDDIYWRSSRKYLCRLQYAWNVRSEANMSRLLWDDLLTWKKIQAHHRRKLVGCKVVKSIKLVRGKRKINIGRIDGLSQIPPQIYTWNSMIDATYLKYFADILFPNTASVTCREFMKFYFILKSLGDELRTVTKSIVDNGGKITLNSIDNVSMKVDRSEIKYILSEGLGKCDTDINYMINLISYPIQKGNNDRGIWSAPLIKIPGEDAYCIAYAVLACGNIFRLIESLFERGKMEIGDREGAGVDRLKLGDAYECEVRRVIYENITKNSLLKNSISSANEIKKSKLSDEQVDIVIKVGSTILVGDIKRWMHPSEDREHYNYINVKVKEAVDQIVRKTNYLYNNINIIEECLGQKIEKPDNIKLIPIVISNTGFGSSLLVGECIVTDAHYLSIILGNNIVITDGILVNGKDHIMKHPEIIYLDEADLESNIKRLLTEPSVLMRFVDRVEWGRHSFPTPLGDLIVETPELGSRLIIPGTIA